MDIREHTARHHHALAALFDRLGSGDHYRALDRAGRTRLLAEELARRATARTTDRGARRGGGEDHCGLLHDQGGTRPLRRRSDRELHRLDGQGRRRRPRRRRARTRRRARRPQLWRRAHRPRAAARDHRRAQLGRAAARRAAARAVVPADGRAAGRHAGGDARLLRLEQGRRHHRLRVGDPPGAARAARCGHRAPRDAAAVPRQGRNGRARRRPDRQGDTRPTVRHHPGRDQDHRAG